MPVDWVVPTDNSDQAYAECLPGVEVMIGTDFTAEMRAASDSLRVLLVPAAGVDRIDFTALPRNVAVANCYEHAAPIAEWALSCAVMLDRNLLLAEKSFRSGDWAAWPGFYGPYRELQGRVWGVVGFGGIGRRSAELAQALNMEVVAVGRAPLAPGKAVSGVEYGYGQEWLEEVLPRADFVLVAVPLNSDTEGFIGQHELSLMQPSAYLLNPARGHVVDETALYNALRSRTIAGAALDVWYNYPDSDNGSPRPASLPFWELANVVMTPHLSGATWGTLKRRARIVAANIEHVYHGQPLINAVPREPA